MKKPLCCLVLVVCAWTLSAEPLSVPARVVSYLISRKQTAALYERAELIISDESQSWEIVLYRKDGADPEHIRLEKFDDAGNGVFRVITITEASGTSGTDLFAYMPIFDKGRIQVDLCDIRTEGVKRRLIMEI